MIRISKLKKKLFLALCLLATLFYFIFYYYISNATTVRRIMDNPTEDNLAYIDQLAYEGEDGIKMIFDILEACTTLPPSNSDAIIISGRAIEALKMSKNKHRISKVEINILRKVKDWSCMVEVVDEADRISKLDANLE
jgi:hypothetical protein